MRDFLVCAVATMMLTGCVTPTRDFTQDHQAAMTKRPGVVLEDAAAGRRLAGRFAALYGNLNYENVRDRVREVYAPGAWFNDTIATEVGIEAIEKYLLKTARGAELVQAKIEDVSVSGSDCYVRWTMTVRTKNLAGGEPIITSGLSQLRFDPEGRIILHQDFWNPAAGIYQHLPLLGPAIRFVNHLITKPE